MGWVGVVRMCGCSLINQQFSLSTQDPHSTMRIYRIHDEEKGYYADGEDVSHLFSHEVAALWLMVP